MFWPCETRTSTCRNFATISSGVYRFFDIAVLLHVKRHSSGRTTSKGEDHIGPMSRPSLYRLYRGRVEQASGGHTEREPQHGGLRVRSNRTGGPSS